MELIKELEEIINPILTSHQVLLSELKFRNEEGMKVLQVAIMHEDGSMDIDTCAIVSESVSVVLDQSDLITTEYYLEVCSAGAERPLINEVQLTKAIDNYVYVVFKETIEQINDVYGYLKEVNETDFVVEYMKKTAKKTLQIPRGKVKSIRLAIKI